MPDSVFQDSVTWLGIKVGSDAEMTPRQRFVSVSYSFGFLGWVISDSNIILSDRVGGSVGIGTASPGEKLEVQGNIKATDTVFASTFSSNSPLLLQTARTTRMFIDDVNGNVGIGATSPQSRLHVNAGSSASELSALRLTNSGSTAGADVALEFDSGNNLAKIVGKRSGTNEIGLSFFTSVATLADAPSERVTIDPGGKVGIGTTIPQNRLDIRGQAVIGSNYAGFEVAPSNGLLVEGNVGIGTTSPATQLHVGSGDEGSTSDLLTVSGFGNQGISVRSGAQPPAAGDIAAIRLYRGTTQAGFISAEPGNLVKLFGNSGLNGITISGANVGIGTNSPAAKLDVAYTSGNGIRTSGVGGFYNFDVGVNTLPSGALGIGDASNYRLVIKGGNVGIGTTSPTNPLQMGSGAFCSAAGTWTNASSRAYKTDIQPLKNKEYADILEKLEKVDVVRFKYKKDPSREHIGLIAEDVPEEIASEDRTGVPTADAIAFLMAAVKAQQTKIQELEEIVKQLKKQTDEK